MALLYGGAGRLTAKNGGFRPGQSSSQTPWTWTPTRARRGTSTAGQATSAPTRPRCAVSGSACAGLVGDSVGGPAGPGGRWQRRASCRPRAERSRGRRGMSSGTARPSACANTCQIITVRRRRRRHRTAPHRTQELRAAAPHAPPRCCRGTFETRASVYHCCRQSAGSLWASRRISKSCRRRRTSQLLAMARSYLTSRKIASRYIHTCAWYEVYWYTRLHEDRYMGARCVF